MNMHAFPDNEYNQLKAIEARVQFGEKSRGLEDPDVILA